MRHHESRPRMTCTMDGCDGEVVASAGGIQLYHALAYGVPYPLDVDHAPKVTREDLVRHLGTEAVAAMPDDVLRRMTEPGRRRGRVPVRP